MRWQLATGAPRRCLPIEFVPQNVSVPGIAAERNLVLARLIHRV
jgi:hypothetical protein